MQMVPDVSVDASEVLKLLDSAASRERQMRRRAIEITFLSNASSSSSAQPEATRPLDDDDEDDDSFGHMQQEGQEEMNSSGMGSGWVSQRDRIKEAPDDIARELGVPRAR